MKMKNIDSIVIKVSLITSFIIIVLGVTGFISPKEQSDECNQLATEWTYSFVEAHDRLMVYSNSKDIADFSYTEDGREWIDYMDKREEIIEKYKKSLELLNEGIQSGCDFYSSPYILQTGIEYQSMSQLKKHTNDIISNQERIVNFMNKNKYK